MASANGTSEFEARLENAQRARRIVWEDVGAGRVIDALVDAAADWLDHEYAPRTGVVTAISKVTGWHPEMVATGLDFIFSAVTRDELHGLVREEAGSLETLSPPASRRRVGPSVVYHALAGNVPGQGIPPIVTCSLACSVLVVRDSRRQPALTDAFRESLGRHEPLLADMVVPVTWPHGPASPGIEAAILAAADRVELHGSNATVHALADRYRTLRPTPVTMHGARVSIGWVGADASLEVAADGFALDVAMYEGRGCLTPHVILVEGSPTRTVSFADALAISLDTLAERWPRARGSVEEEAARRRFLDEAEIAALASDDERVLVGRDAAWAVRIGPASRVEPGPGLRCVRVFPASSRREAVSAARASLVPVAAVGIADGCDADSTLRTHGEAFAPVGDCALLPAGRMQAPPITWRQDGCRRLGDLLGKST
jgi:acyl-CoA reductase-like NAD-dependent aldehyde dehydrogenase